MPSTSPLRPRAPRVAPLQAGWTLTELLMALALMGILAALAMPAYQQQQRAARRSEARSALQQLQFDQARHRNTHGYYATSLGALGRTQEHSPSGLYRLVITHADADGYTLEAHPQGAQTADGACAPLRLAWRDPALEVRSSGATLDSDPEHCWAR